MHKKFLHYINQKQKLMILKRKISLKIILLEKEKKIQTMLNYIIKGEFVY